MLYGGFAYFDADKRFVACAQVTAVGNGSWPTNVMHFAKPQKWNYSHTAYFSEQNRIQPTTLNALRGARHVAWIAPNEKVTATDGTPDFIAENRGAFVYWSGWICFAS